MESVIRSLRIETYKAQLAVCNQVRAVLLKKLENVNLIAGERLSIGHRSDKALKEGRALGVMLDLMVRQNRVVS